MKVEPGDFTFKIEIESEEETDALGRTLASLAEPGQVFGLIGGLGAGKTRLSRAFAESLGVDPATISSPTFVLIHEYAGRIPVYHFDAYRLSGPEDLDALGAGEYFAAGGISLVEWADLVLDRLPHDAWIIRIEPTGLNSRDIFIQGPDLPRLADALRSV